MAKPRSCIIIYGLEKEAHRLRNKGNSVRKIAEVLTQKAGTRITFNAVQRYFDSFKVSPEVEEAAIQIPKDVAKVAVEILEEKITTVQEVDAVLKKIEAVITRAEGGKDDSLLIRAVKEAVRYYDLKAKLTGDIGPNRAASAPQNNVVIYIPDNGRD